MRRIAYSLMLTAALLAGCSAGGVVDSADTAPNESAQAPAEKAKIGQPVTIEGNEDGSQIQVIAVKVVPTTTSGNQFEAPQGGMRYAAVQFKLVNTGTAAYDDAPMNAAKVIDSEGQQFPATIVTEVKAGPMLPSSVKLAKGGTALGYLAFEVPKAAKIVGVQFGIDSGFGQTAEWVVAAK